MPILKYDDMTPEQQAKARDAQREKWTRSNNPDVDSYFDDMSKSLEAFASEFRLRVKEASFGYGRADIRLEPTYDAVLTVGMIVKAGQEYWDACVKGSGPFTGTWSDSLLGDCVISSGMMRLADPEILPLFDEADSPLEAAEARLGEAESTLEDARNNLEDAKNDDDDDEILQMETDVVEAEVALDAAQKLEERAREWCDMAESDWEEFCVDLEQRYQKAADDTEAYADTDEAIGESLSANDAEFEFDEDGEIVPASYKG